MVEGRYPMTVWNWYYPLFITLIKNMAEEAKLLSLSSYLEQNTVELDYNVIKWTE
jgi:hypothetical protein